MKPSPTNEPPAWSLWRALSHRATRRVFEWTHRTAGRVILVLIAILLYLRFVGFPGVLVRRAIAWLAEQEIYVQVHRVHLDFFPAGVVAKGVRFFDVPRAETPLLELERAALSFRPASWLKREAGFSGLVVRGAVLRINTTGDRVKSGGPHNLVVENVRAVLGFDAAGIRVEQCQAVFMGVRLRGSGLIDAVEPSEAGPPALRDVARTLKAALRKFPSWLPELVEQWHAVEFKEPPRADVVFRFRTAEPILSEAQIKMAGRRTIARGVVLDEWTLRALLRDALLEVDPVSFTQEGNRCHARGRMDLRDRVAEFRAYSSLPPHVWLSLLPGEVGEQAAREGVFFEGNSSFEVWGGPAPLDRLLESMSGWISVDEAMFREVWIERAFAQFSREGVETTFSHLDATLGRDAQRGVIRGSAKLRLDTMEYGIQGTAEGDPHAVLPLVTSNQAEVIKALDFRAPPRAEIRATGVLTNAQAFSLSGTLSGREFTYSGADIARFDTELGYTNDVLTFRNMKLERPEGGVEGWVAMDFGHGRVDYDVVSTADPVALGLVIGSNIHAFVSQFRFEGPVHVVSRGRVDYTNLEGIDLEAEVTAQNAGMDWLLVDRGSCRIRALGTRVEFEDVEGSAFGGTFSGTASIWDVDDPEDVRYAFSGEIRDADFRRVMASLRGVQGDIYQGALSVTVAVTGVIGEGKGPTVSGTGRVQIREGALFQVPLLGGLSQILSRVYPRLGFATQTDFSSSVSIADSRVSSDDAHLEGRLISAGAEGCYHFDQRLDVRVHVKLLRRGYVASVLRLVTFPVTKLLEVHLGGTLSDPRWRPQNLPKELFLMFD